LLPAWSQYPYLPALIVITMTGMQGTIGMMIVDMHGMAIFAISTDMTPDYGIPGYGGMTGMMVVSAGGGSLQARGISTPARFIPIPTHTYLQSW
jgi:hypothetical protein